MLFRSNGIRVLPAPLIPAEGGIGRCGAAVRSLIGLAKNHFDWIVVDLPPAAAEGTMSLAVELGRLVAVTTPGLCSLHLAARRLAELAAAGVAEGALRVVLNRTTAGDLIPLNRVGDSIGRGLAGTVPDDPAAVQVAGEGSLSGGGAMAIAIRRLAEDLPRAPREPSLAPPRTSLTMPAQSLMAAAG